MNLNVKVYSLTATGKGLEKLNKKSTNDPNRNFAIASNIDEAHVHIVSIEAIPDIGDSLAEYDKLISEGLNAVKTQQMRDFSVIYAGELEPNNPDNFPVYSVLLLFAHPGILRADARQWSKGDE